MDSARRKASGFRCGIPRCAFIAPTRPAVEAHIRVQHTAFLATTEVELDVDGALEAADAYAREMELKTRELAAEAATLRPVAENARRAQQGRSEAAARWNRARVGHSRADEARLRGIVKSLAGDGHSDREILRIMQARGVPIGEGGNARRKIARFRAT
jgi:hypothetical protein